MLTGHTFYLEQEVALMIWIQSHINQAAVKAASLITLFGEDLIIIAILGFIYWSYDKEYGKYIGTNIVLVNVLNPLMKNAALRRRPYLDHAKIKCLKPVDSSADIRDISAQGYSFPSGHSMNAAAVYVSMARYRKKPGSAPGKILVFIFSILMPLLVGISRFTLGVHYPTDVLAGWACGLAVIFLVPWLMSKCKNRYILWGFFCLLGAIGFFYCKTTDYYTGYGLMLGFFLGTAFEERYVHFENTDSLPLGLARLVGGIAIYLVLNTLLKLPFSADLLESATFTAYLIRTVRYFIVVFVMIGVYPMVFGRLKGNLTQSS